MVTAQLRRQAEQPMGEDAPSRELALWLEETERAFDDVRELEDALREHRKELRDHAPGVGVEVARGCKEHKSLEKRHHTIMAYWQLLCDALTQKQ